MGTHLQNLKYRSAFNLHICFCNIDMMICHSIEEHVGSEDFTVLGCDNYPIRVIILPLMRPNWTIMTLPSQGLFQYFPEVSSLAIWHHDAIQNISALLAKPPIFCIDCWQSDVMLGKFARRRRLGSTGTSSPAESWWWTEFPGSAPRREAPRVEIPPATSATALHCCPARKPLVGWPRPISPHFAPTFCH